MDYGACNVVYFDRRATADFRAQNPARHSRRASTLDGVAVAPNLSPIDDIRLGEVDRNVDSILTSFSDVYVCKSPSSCFSQVASLAKSKVQRATVVFVSVPQLERRTSFARALDNAGSYFSNAISEDMTGSQVLQRLKQEAERHKASNLILPIILLSGGPYIGRKQSISSPPVTPGSRGASPADPPPSWKDPSTTARYLDEGAIDVLKSPISAERIEGLPAQVYRIYKDVARSSSLFGRRSRRNSTWVSTVDTQPYHYMREAMVSSLIDGICNPEHVDEEIEHFEVDISQDRQDQIARSIAQWSFSAHDYNDDELLFGVRLMLEHALKMPELENFRLPSEDLTKFLAATRQVYNSFVLYHNFRHACDVTQAAFYFLLHMKALPSYDPITDQKPDDDVERLLDPFHALTILISAIGHDVGHPGVNNLFLITTNTPLAQLYSDRSVLESFHCAAYSQILRRYWPSAFSDRPMRKLMINTIIATDMAEHRVYMNRMADLQETLDQKGRKVNEWVGDGQAQLQSLLCCLLIKCADISNVPRPIHVATQWAQILTDEFAAQHEMEQELQIPTCLFGGVPQRNDVVGLGNSQVGFIDTFGDELFRQISRVLPSMHFTVVEIEKNKQYWENRIADELKKTIPERHSTTGFGADTSKTKQAVRNVNENAVALAALTSTPDSLSRRSSIIGPLTTDPLLRRSSSGVYPPKPAPSPTVVSQLDGQSLTAAEPPREGPYQSSPPLQGADKELSNDVLSAQDTALSSDQKDTKQQHHLNGLQTDEPYPNRLNGYARETQGLRSGYENGHEIGNSNGNGNGVPPGDKRAVTASSESSKTTEGGTISSLSSTLRKLRSSVNLSKEKVTPSESAEEVKDTAIIESSPGRRKESWKFWKSRSKSAGPERRTRMQA